MVKESSCAKSLECINFRIERLLFFINETTNVLTLSELSLAQMMLTTFHQTCPGLYWVDMVGHVLNLSNCSHVLQGCSPHYRSCNTQCP